MHCEANCAEYYRRNSSTVTLDLVLFNQACCAGLYLYLGSKGLGSFETHHPATSLPHCTVSGRIQLVYDPRSTATWRDKQNIQKKYYISVQPAGLLLIFQTSGFHLLWLRHHKKINHILNSILSSSVSERGHFCTFKYCIFCGPHPAVVAMYLAGAPDNVVTSRHPSGYWIARGNGPERPCIMVHLRLPSSWKFQLQVFANGVPHKKHL